jgi:hypothetical protein
MLYISGATSDSEILDSHRTTKDEIRNGKPMSNGGLQSDTKDKKDRVEFPQDSDQRKLNQLFDAFKVPKTKDLSNKSHTTVKRVTTKKYEESNSDSDSSLSTDTEKSPEVLRKSSPKRKVDSVESTVSASNSGTDPSKSHDPKEKKLQRNFSDDSDQTLLSDDVPFSKSSTETQIKVEIHSDESISPTPSVKQQKEGKVNSAEDVVKDKSVKGKIKQTATEVIMAMKMSSHSPTLPTNQNHQSNSKLADPKRYQPGRSPSPYSFDSIPSSHANSPLPVKKHDSHISRESSDTDSTSRMSTADFSGTESSHIRESSSGTEDYVVEEISKVRFRRVAKKAAEKVKASSKYFCMSVINMFTFSFHSLFDNSLSCSWLYLFDLM